MISGLRLAPPDPGWALGAPADDDQTGWLVTFSDLVLQLFAFVLVAMVLGGHRADEAAPRSLAAPPGAAADDLDATRLAAAGEQPRAVRILDEPPPSPADDEAAASLPEPAPPSASAPLPDETPADAGIPDEPAAPSGIEALEDRLRELARAAGREDAISLRVGAADVTVTLSDAITFPSGRAELLPGAMPILGAIRTLAASLPEFALHVEGHTDEVRIQTAAFPSNLELSLARAAQVARQLTAGDAALLARTAASGFGEHHPVASNADAAGRARNRRVEIRLVRQEPRAG